jgi:hypothetical protein
MRLYSDNKPVRHKTFYYRKIGKTIASCQTYSQRDGNFTFDSIVSKLGMSNIYSPNFEAKLQQNTYFIKEKLEQPKASLQQKGFPALRGR